MYHVFFFIWLPIFLIFVLNDSKRSLYNDFSMDLSKIDANELPTNNCNFSFNSQQSNLNNLISF